MGPDRPPRPPDERPPAETQDMRSTNAPAERTAKRAGSSGRENRRPERTGGERTGGRTAAGDRSGGRAGGSVDARTGHPVCAHRPRSSWTCGFQSGPCAACARRSGGPGGCGGQPVRTPGSSPARSGRRAEPADSAARGIRPSAEDHVTHQDKIPPQPRPSTPRRLHHARALLAACTTPGHASPPARLTRPRSRHPDPPAASTPGQAAAPHHPPHTASAAAGGKGHTPSRTADCAGAARCGAAGAARAAPGRTPRSPPTDHPRPAAGRRTQRRTRNEEPAGTGRKPGRTRGTGGTAETKRVRGRTGRGTAWGGGRCVGAGRPWPGPARWGACPAARPRGRTAPRGVCEGFA